MNKFTIKMLAKELQLSVSTVSKALSDSHEISSATKLRVNELADKLNYVPNHYASSLGKRKSKTIGVVIPEVVDIFFAQAINGIESIANEKGYHVMIYLTHESFEKEKAILKDFEGGRVDGVLMSVTRATTSCDHIAALMSMDIPLLFFDRAFDEIETAKITTNDYESAYEATVKMIEKGSRNIAFLSFSSTLSISSNRLNGYKDALLDQGIKITQGNILNLNDQPEHDYLILKKKLKSAKRPDGILASVGKFTIPIYQACLDLKLKIPEDIQVISFSNVDTASFLTPPLSTIEQPAFEVGKTAASLLVKKLERKKFELKKEVIIIPSKLILRGSTRP